MKQKITVGIIAFAIISVSFTIGVGVNVNAINFIEDIPGVILWGPSFEPKDVAWDDAGSMAVVVGKEFSVGPHAWVYFQVNNTWLPITTGAEDQTLTGVCWDRGVNNRFYFCGLADGSTTIASVYYLEPHITLTAQLPNLAPYDNFNGISCDSGGNPAVVCSFSFIQYFSWEGNTWNLFNDWDGVFTEVELYSIDYSTTLNRFVAVGCFGGSQGILMYTDQGPYVPWPGTIYTYKDHTVPLEMPFNAVAMNNLQSGGLVVGHTVYRVIFSTVGKGPDLTTTWELIEGEEWIEDSFITEYRDVEWDNTYTEAAIVGQRWNTGLPGYEGYYWRLYAPPSLNLVNVYGNGILDEPYSCAGFKPPSSPRWFMIPSASGGIRVNVDASDMSTTITVNAQFPKLYWIGFNETDVPRTPRLNQQVVPDSSYIFSWEYNYSEGYDITQTEILAWFDAGAMGAGSTYPIGPGVNQRTLAFSILYNPIGDVAMVQYPNAPILEVNIVSATSWITDTPVPIDPLQDWYQVEVEVYIGPQTQAADGSGFLSGDSNFGTPLEALQDQFSWDFNITVRDTVYTTAFNTSYGEFGIEKAVSILVTGNPTGNAPPGSSGVLLMNPSIVTYSANYDYWVNVSIPDLEKDGNPAGPWITADHIQVRNMHIHAGFGSDIAGQTYFGFSGDELCVWGLEAPATPLAPVGNGTQSAGPFASNYNYAGTDDYTVVDWWVDVIATTPEGVYWETITFSIETP